MVTIISRHRVPVTKNSVGGTGDQRVDFRRRDDGWGWSRIFLVKSRRHRFLGDSASYIIGLMVLTASLYWRAGTAMLQAASMNAFGLWVLGSTIWYLTQGGMPGAMVMGSIGTLALLANVISAALLFGFRTGDSNMR